MAATSLHALRKPRTRQDLLGTLLCSPLAALSLTLLVPLIFALL